MSKAQFKKPLYKNIKRMTTTEKRNALIVITGNVGTGKSLLAIKIAETLDPTFTAENIKERVLIKPEQFIELVAKRSKKLKAGSAIIIDEAGTQMYSRQWHSINNQMINYILQTFRHRRLIVIFTLPSFTFLDVHARRMFNFYIETLKIDFKKKQTRCKVFKISYNKMKGDDPYKQYFVRRNSNGILTRLERTIFPKPSEDIVNAYEKYAGEFKQKIAEQALEQAMKAQAKENKKNISAKDIAAEVVEDLDKFTKDWQGKKIVNIHVVANEYSVGVPTAKKVKAIVEQHIKDKKDD